MSPQPAIVAPDSAWWAESRRRVFYDTHTPDWTDPHQRGRVPDPTFPLLSAVRPDEDLEVMANAGVNAVVLFAKCQYGNAYYPTAVGRQHAALGDRDLFGEQLAAAHRRGIRVIAYFSNMWDVAAAGAHPEWQLVPVASRAGEGRWPALCLRGGYRDYALTQVAEIAARYPIDGLWSDILTAGPCVCGECAAAFEERFGIPTPGSRADPGWIDLIHFWQDTLREYLAEQKEILTRVRPHAALIPNFYATTFVDAMSGLSAEHLDVADVGSSEGYTDWHGLGFPSFASAYVRAAVQDRPHEVLVSRFVHTWDFTLRSTAQLRYEAFTVAAHGAAVSVDDQPSATGALDPRVYERLTPVFRRIEEREPWLRGVEPVRWAAVWAGQNARELDSLLGGPDAPALGEQSAVFPPSDAHPDPSDLVAAVTGTYRALVESHLPVGLIDGRPSSLERLAHYSVVVLPDVLSVSADELAALRAFVEGGGGLVVTGPTGVRNRAGDPAVDTAVEDLLGLKWGAESEFRYPYVRLTDTDLVPGSPAPLLPHYGPILTMTPIADGVRPLATRTDPVLETDDVTYWHNNQPAPGRDTDAPVIVERRLGQGRIIASAARLGNNHARLGHEGYRELIAALARRAARDQPDVTILGGARSTEMVVSRRDDELIAHFVSGAPVARLGVVGAPQPAAVEDIMRLSSICLQVPATTISAHRVVGCSTVPLAIEDGRVTVRDTDDWETIVLRVAS
jgi:hypothetical protein